jgi:hypothetical protein
MYHTRTARKQEHGSTGYLYGIKRQHIDWTYKHKTLNHVETTNNQGGDKQRSLIRFYNTNNTKEEEKKALTITVQIEQFALRITK